MIPVACVTSETGTFNASFGDVVAVIDNNDKHVNSRDVVTVSDTYVVDAVTLTLFNLISAIDAFTVAGVSDPVGATVDVATVVDTYTLSVDGLIIRSELSTSDDSFVGFLA